MATLDDVRAIAQELPGVSESIDGHRGGANWVVGRAAFAWERGPSGRDLTQLAEQGREWPPGEIIGIRTDGEQVKQALLETFPDVFFTIPHFDGYPAVLVRLDRIDLDQLREVITDAWLLKAPKRAAAAWLADHPSERTI
ncbi:MmcQ/YjbR family DNA-binding protein [Microbacterium hibisci]|uniref:MmcQ/YjbR family DNA-binding protein n=1 Tax=Microbacterium hibisci TaxID=2036000 RepID=UPI001940A8C4|nr:MmcQ/YjbR family DNA-binding protein [Microbacterium hibisci]